MDQRRVAAVGEQPARKVLFAPAPRTRRLGPRGGAVEPAVPGHLHDPQTAGGLTMRVEHWLYAVPRWFRAVVHRQDVERELDDELRYHIEEQTAANIAQGMGADEARRAALAAFGGVERIKDESRDARRITIVDTVGQDLAYARRVVTSSPGFALAVAATLALGIGATATMFGVLDRLLL